MKMNPSMENNPDFIVFPKDATEKQKECMHNFLKQCIREKEYLCIIYHPDCGCEIDQFVILDRYPMSLKIISRCPVCEKGCLMEISNPITFHLPMLNKDYSLEELKKCHIADGPQKHLIKKYQFLTKTFD